MKMKELAVYLEKLGEKNPSVLILSHPHADPDAVGSVLGLGEILESLGAEAIKGVPSNLSKLSESVMSSLNEELPIDPSLEADFVMILDTSSLGQLGDYEEKIEDSNSKVVFIDHHRPDEETRKRTDEYYVDESASSAVELILRAARELDFHFTPKTATIMLTGIISDTGNFKFANGGTFKAVTDLLEDGADYRKAMEALKTPEDYSKKVAMLKAAKRLETYKSHGRWIAFSEVGAYESDAASMFIKIGADVALVASSNGDKVRISSRSRSGVSSETHLHLGELMSKLADQFDGTGGGHAGAAGMTTSANLDDVKEEALKKVKSMLREKGE
ncbi:hypothetical protein AKJ65_00180 [candidate division MSBL1 archaeon SCGC-AAA259E19]|uniref:DDH domain-containing protein n=1 Tax=candidate division MSBL1 archaeon SCGC-AAA259E19 TaxID=1698264 RepID=A0A133UNV9_9EURY|nr:hypothetical protein AKJ65_00180 [candidate division MSBL1 archaeon SCGC-AAA259E19]